jgi:hypothetical protein
MDTNHSGGLKTNYANFAAMPMRRPAAAREAGAPSWNQPAVDPTGRGDTRSASWVIASPVLVSAACDSDRPIAGDGNEHPQPDNGGNGEADVANYVGEAYTVCHVDADQHG